MNRPGTICFTTTWAITPAKGILPPQSLGSSSLSFSIFRFFFFFFADQDPKIEDEDERRAGNSRLPVIVIVVVLVDCFPRQQTDRARARYEHDLGRRTCCERSNCVEPRKLRST